MSAQRRKARKRPTQGFRINRPLRKGSDSPDPSARGPARPTPAQGVRTAYHGGSPGKTEPLLVKKQSEDVTRLKRERGLPTLAYGLEWVEGQTVFSGWRQCATTRSGIISKKHSDRRHCALPCRPEWAMGQPAPSQGERDPTTPVRTPTGDVAQPLRSGRHQQET